MRSQLPNIKCVVWDLDNTLWKGILLEDSHVMVHDDTLNVIELLDQRGIVQSVASKNDFDHAWARLEELGLSDYLLIPQIGWNPKSRAIRKIATQLSFSYNTIAFIDDQPTERAEVNFHLPDVRCYDHTAIPNLLDRPEFNPPRVTVDSKRRRQMYQASLQRDREREAFVGADDEFMRSLHLELSINNATIDDLARVEELTLRTSQMNATGIHYSEEHLSRMRGSPDHEVLIGTLTDRFGTYGAIGVALLQKLDSYWRIKLLATSCRVVTLGIGSVILSWIINRAAEAGVHLVADFRRTERNRIMEVAYRFAGFSDSECSCFTGGIRNEGVSLLHIVPDERELPSTVAVSSCDCLVSKSRPSCGG